MFNNMKFEYDKDADAAYIYLADTIMSGEVKKTTELNENVILDFDNRGKIIGVEILNASKTLNKKLLLRSIAHK